MGKVDFDKFLIDYLNGGFSTKQMIVKYLLEKQGLQIVKDKIVPIEDKKEPKFKKGDWVVVDDGRVGKIVHYTVDFTDVSFGCNHMSIGTGRIRHWAIEDAKAGDVLLSSILQPFIFNGHINEERFFLCGSYCGINSVGDFCYYCSNMWTHVKGVVPADEEQRELLFSKMHEAGYKWNAEELKLEKIEQKQEWSDEDENHIKHILDVLEGKQNEQMERGFNNLNSDVFWLKSLKDRMQPRPKQECGEEGENMITAIVAALSLLEQQNKATGAFDREKNWLKSLKEIYTWKPSEMQMKALVCACVGEMRYLDYLNSLCDDPKKLV